MVTEVSVSYFKVGVIMKILLFSRRHLLVITFVLLTCFTFFMLYRLYPRTSSEQMVMGGSLLFQLTKEGDTPLHTTPEQKPYFRPSSLPALNERFTGSFFDPYYDKSTSQITLPEKLHKTPEDSIINYFSILREAANPVKNKFAGCGTIGQAKIPYPLAYQFLSSDYKTRLPYEDYLASFQNILHTNLIKYKPVPVYNAAAGKLRYFVEIETLQGLENGLSAFVYYYAFIDLIKENGLYQIENIEFTGEDFLCAPYHGWSHDAKSSVEIRYGDWCNLIKKMNPIKQKDYIKQVSFEGTDGKDYLILFYELTNQTDIEIAQYIKNENGKWELTKLSPEKCIEDKKAAK